MYYFSTSSRCVGPLVSLSNTCKDEVATVDPTKEQTLFRFAPLKNEEGTYRIIIKDRNTKNCARFLSATADCDTMTVNFATSDNSEGLQRWIFYEVTGGNESPTPSPTPSPETLPTPTPTPSPEAPSSPSPTESSILPPFITAFSTSATTGQAIVSLPCNVAATSGVVSLSPGEESQEISLPASPEHGIAIFNRLSPGMTYTATAVFKIPGSNASSPVSEPSSFTTPTNSDSDSLYNPIDDSTICDGFGEILGNNGECICDVNDMKDGPFLPNGKGGCFACNGFGEIVDDGNCICDSKNEVDGPFLPNGEGGCKCPDAQMLSEDGTACTCPTLYVKCGTKCCENLNFGLDPINLCNGNYGCGWSLDLNSAGDRAIFSEVDQEVCYNWGCLGETKGIVFIMFFNGDEWKPVATNQSIGTQLGHSVAISGDGNRVVISDTMANAKGEAYVWKYDDKNGWEEEQTLLPTDMATLSGTFGNKVAINEDGTICVVGDVQGKTTPADSAVGTATVFRYTGGTWNQEQVLASSDRASNGVRFGSDIAISDSGEVLVISDEGNENSMVGAVYIFRYTNGLWSEEKIIKPSPAVDAENFGRGVAINGKGDVLVIGDNDYEIEGRAFVYRYVGGDWVLDQPLFSSTTEDYGLEFGQSFGINYEGDLIAVGDFNYAGGGSVHVFRYYNNQWNEELPVLLPLYDVNREYVGWDIAMSSDGSVLLTADKDAGYVHSYRNIQP